MLRLLVTWANQEQAFVLPEGISTLGSSRENNIVLDIPGVSRRHAILTSVPGGVEVKNAQSKQGLLVEQERVERTVLTRGLRVQVGAAWLEIEEVSTSEETLIRLSEDGAERSGRQRPTTTVEPEAPSKSSPEKEAALDLAFHLSQVGVGVPQKRTDLLLRVKAVLQAEAFATLRMTRFGNLKVWESIGQFSSREIKLLSALAAKTELKASEQVMLKRMGKILISGRGLWFLVAGFKDDGMAREAWRKAFLRFLALQLFKPDQTRGALAITELLLLLEYVKGNVSAAARILGVNRGTVYNTLKRHGLGKKAKGRKQS